MSDETSIIVNNTRYQGWKDVEATISIESCASSFSLSVSDGDGLSSSTVPIIEGDECVVKIGDDKIVTGYVDEISPSFGPSDHGISISGRSKSQDLIDCSTDSSLEWKNKKFVSIAQELAKPFGIGIKVDTIPEANSSIPVFKVQPGESPFEALDRAARGIGVLLIPDANGDLLITKPGTISMGIDLIQGENIKNGSGSFSSRDRFSQYIVLGQGETKQDFAIKGIAEDPYIKRRRPLVIIAEEKATQTYLKQRAAWEAKVRAARAGTINLTVQGWRAGDGQLWMVNRLVNVQAKSLRVNGQLLITTCTYRKNSSGTTTDLVLRRSDAFSKEPTISAEPEKKPNTSTSTIKRDTWTGKTVLSSGVKSNR